MPFSLFYQAVVILWPAPRAQSQVLAIPPCTPMVPTVPGISLSVQETWFSWSLNPSTWSTTLTVILIMLKFMTMGLCRLEANLAGETWAQVGKWLHTHFCTAAGKYNCCVHFCGVHVWVFLYGGCFSRLYWKITQLKENNKSLNLRLDDVSVGILQRYI